MADSGPADSRGGKFKQFHLRQTKKHVVKDQKKKKIYNNFFYISNTRTKLNLISDFSISLQEAIYNYNYVNFTVTGRGGFGRGRGDRGRGGRRGRGRRGARKEDDKEWLLCLKDSLLSCVLLFI